MSVLQLFRGQSRKLPIQRPNLPHAADPTPGFNDGEELWPWQTCTEFGFYQTCEFGSECFYTQGLFNLSDEMSFCTTNFKIPADVVAANIEYSNAYYGSDAPRGSRVLYVNGEVDPWRANSLTRQISLDLPTAWVPGASHHAWTHPSMVSDQDSVVAVRQTIRDQVRLFLKAPRDGAEGTPPPQAVIV